MPDMFKNQRIKYLDIYNISEKKFGFKRVFKIL